MSTTLQPPNPAQAEVSDPRFATSEIYQLELYVAGSTPQSSRAIVNLRKLCEEHLTGRYELRVFNIVEHPFLAAAEQIIAVPTLIKKQPAPLRRFIGDMSQTMRILAGFDLPTP